MQIFKIISLLVLLGAVFVAGVMFIQEKSSKGYNKRRAKQGEQVSRGIGIGVIVGTAIGILVNREEMYYFSALGMGIGLLAGLVRSNLADKQ